MIEREVALLKDLGVRYVRLEFLWWQIEPERGRFEWSVTDYIVAKCREAGLELVPQLVYAPNWAAPKPIDPPADPMDYYRFVQVVVLRYHKEIHYWEMWNEPDIQGKYFSGDAAAYVNNLLKPGYEAAKAVDPDCFVLIAGISQGGGTDFLVRCYRAGAAPYFDIANYHCYGSPKDVIRLGADFRGIMAAHGDEAKPLWLTEYGYMELAAPHDLYQQMLIRAIHTDNPYIQAAFYYELRDDDIYDAPDHVLKSETFGLLTKDYTPKDAYATFKGIAQ